MKAKLLFSSFCWMLCVAVHAAENMTGSPDGSAPIAISFGLHTGIVVNSSQPGSFALEQNGQAAPIFLDVAGRIARRRGFAG
jgi:hypothetical protein